MPWDQVRVAAEDIGLNPDLVSPNHPVKSRVVALAPRRDGHLIRRHPREVTPIRKGLKAIQSESRLGR